MSNINYDKKTYKYTNESFSGCDMTASITVRHLDKKTGRLKNFTYIVGELQTISYSINMDKAPVRSIGNINAKDYVVGQRTIAGSIVFNVFNRHFSKEIMEALNDGYESFAGESYLVDEIPPFDITISAANEYGYRSKLCIFGIRLLNEGQVMSINDVFVENTYQFYATDVDYLDDEMKYSRNKKNQFILKGNNLKWNEPKDNLVSMNNDLKYDNYGYVQDKTIRLSASVKQPVGDRKNGIVDFYIIPGIQDGKIVIKKDSGESTTINIKAPTTDNTGDNEWYKNNKKSHSNKKLSPGIYTAIVETSDNRKSNKIKFNIVENIEESKIKKYAPAIKNVKNNSFVVISSEPLHNKVKVNEGKFATDSGNILDLKNGQCLIENLKEGSYYSVYTFESSTGLSSPSTTVMTLSKNNTDYKRLGNYIYSNSSLLIYTGNTKRYLELLEEAHLRSNSTGEDIKTSLLFIKTKYIKIYKDAAGSGSDNVDKANLDVKMISEIISLQYKLESKIVATVNKSSVPTPIMHVDENGNAYFEFDKSITEAEFYLRDGNIEYFKQHVESGIFREIDNKKNCFRYIGKNGSSNFIEAISKDKRSSRLDFYIMTNEEKTDYRNKNASKKKIDDALLNRATHEIRKNIDNTATNKEIEQALIYSVKKIEELVDPPYIYKDDNKIYINSNIETKSVYKRKFYFCIGTLDEIKNDDMIYKIEFDSLNSRAVIDSISYDIEEGKAYGCWIENDTFEQISRASTFEYNNDDNSEVVNEFEFSNNYGPIISLSNSLNVFIENNSNYNNYNTVINFLNTIYSSGAIDSNIERSVSYMKRYIGSGGLEDYSLVDMKIINNKLVVNSNIYLTLVEYDIEKGIVSSMRIESGENVFSRKNNSIITCVTDDFKIKSSVYYLNSNGIKVVQ